MSKYQDQDSYRGQNNKQQLMDKLTKKLAKPLAKLVLSQLTGERVEIFQELDREFAQLQASRRHVDYLVWAKIGGKEKILVHLEFQTKNENNMVFRMLNYALLIYQKYGVYPLQIVVYVGLEELRMQDYFKAGRKESYLEFKYLLIDLNQFSKEAEKLLEEESPEAWLLAALTLRPEDPRLEKLLSTIIEKMHKYFQDKNNLAGEKRLVGQEREPRGDLEDYYLLLEIIAVHKHFLKTLLEVKNMFDVKLEDLPSYQEGMKKGEKKGVIETIVLLSEKRFHLGEEEKNKLAQRLEKLSIPQLQQVIEIVLNVNTFKEMLEKLP